MSEKTFITIHEAAAYLGINIKTLHRKCKGLGIKPMCLRGSLNRGTLFVRSVIVDRRQEIIDYTPTGRRPGKQTRTPDVLCDRPSV